MKKEGAVHRLVRLVRGVSFEDVVMDEEIITDYQGYTEILWWKQRSVDLNVYVIIFLIVLITQVNTLISRSIIFSKVWITSYSFKEEIKWNAYDG